MNFREPGTTHIHIDGAHSLDELQRTLVELERRGYPSKFRKVIHFLLGPQRECELETYASHTPGFSDKEEFSFFSTTRIPHPAKIHTVIKFFLRSLRRWQGAIVELEYVLALMEDGQERSVPIRSIPRLRWSNGDLVPLPSLPVEIHHGFDIPKTRKSPPALENLLSEFTRLDITLGGLFLFEKGDTWAYRSNSFCRIEQYLQRLWGEHRAIKEYLLATGLDVRLSSIAERVLGIWKFSAPFPEN